MTVLPSRKGIDGNHPTAMGQKKGFRQPQAVSVVICTLNREEPLVHVLELLKSQTVSPLEILVIDQSREHQLPTRRYLKENDSRIRLIPLTFPSTTAARNLARKEARGDLILFLDDDVLFRPNLIQSHLENYEDMNIGAISGKVLYHGSEENDLPWAARVTRSGKYLRNFTSNQRCFLPTLYGCNMSIRGDVLQEAGEFDVNYWGNFLWEEVDYAFQIRKKGYRILYDPRAVVFHVLYRSGWFWPFLLYRQKRTWLTYFLAARGNVLPLVNQIPRAFKLAKKIKKA
jgi:GT2 family glycosyltransferase